ncbi:MAG TPA: hypothetical protein VLC98_00650 [Phnomibacter sp.]|nr:hypothetical protein [Phnomibacter sp.]
MAAFAQPKLEFNLKKPKQFEERKLGSEKMADKKFTPVRKFFQNTFTHYNYYFNANEKLNSVIAFAKESQKDDYTDLLSFYPYSLKTTSASGDLDSVIVTATTGILLHDLRNAWIDNLYTLIGKAYLLRMDYDSAFMTFQYINTSYAPKEEGGFDQPIASNSVEGSNALSISTKEKTNLAKKAFSEPPSRNESFIWMIRTLTEQGNYLDASSLVSTLHSDPIFPDRLKPELDEVTAYLFYRIEQWDSAAVYTEKATALADGLHDKARRYYLAGQLYQLAGMHKQASEAFERSTQTAVDPVMEIYARLNTIRLRKSEDPNIIDQNIADLKSLARKDSYRNYRDIIYYAIAMFEVEREGYDAADNYLSQSIAYNEENPAQRSASFKLQGDVRYAAKKYGKAALPYDSVNLALAKPFDSLQTAIRRPGTKAVSQADLVIDLQDSLLRIASMEEPARTAAVKDIAKRLRKERGLKEEAENAGRGGSASVAATNTDLFSQGGTWYFYDANRRANGFIRFRERFGDRPNADNWRRISAISINATIANNTNTGTNPVTTPVPTETNEDNEKYDTADISFDNLYSRLPISPEKQARANNRITLALFFKALALHEQIEDYPEAIKVYEQVLSRRDTGQIAAQTLFNLIHCYTKVGNTQAAANAKRMLEQNFAQTTIAQKSANGPTNQKKEAAAEAKATEQYNKIYSLFIQGDFKQAEELKRKADSTFGKDYWTPQLLYIETVYYLQTKQDTIAGRKLDAIIASFPDHPLAKKAALIKEVLPRRREIETYLTNLEVTRTPEDKIMIPVSGAKPTQVPTLPTQAPTQKIVPATVNKPILDTSARTLVAAPPAPTAVVLPYTIKAEDASHVAIVLENIDPAYVNEVVYSLSNSPQRNSVDATVAIEKKKLRDKLFLVIIRSPSFNTATAAYRYIEYLKPIATKNILSWLGADKYHYIIVNDENLNKLQQDPALDVYEKILKQTFPGKF